MLRVDRTVCPRIAVISVLSMVVFTSCHHSASENPLHSPENTHATSEPFSDAILPPLIPSVQRWESRPGEFRLRADTQIVAPTEFRTEAETLAQDLTAALGRTFPVVDQEARDGDIELRHHDVEGLPNGEGYEITTSGHLVISSPTATGAFWATRTIVQWLRQSPLLPGGVAHDWPHWPERAFMIDVARKFYPPEWLRDRIRELAYWKFNTLHLHLIDSQAFRVESETVPDAVAAQHYSKKDIADLVAYAARFHIDVIPEFDMPGHASALLSHRPELGVRGEWGLTVMNLADQANWQLAEDIINEYLPLFPAKVWFLGADEWMGMDQFRLHPELTETAVQRYGPDADPIDLFHGFINHMNEVVKKKGKTLRIWNSTLTVDSTVSLDPDISIDHWSGAGLSAQEEVDAGHEILNSSSRQLYYVIDRRIPDPAAIYHHVNPNAFPLAAYDESVLEPGHPKARGAELCVWEGGHGPDQASIARTVDPMLRALSQVVWGSPTLTDDYEEFQGISENVGSAPAW